MFLVRSSSVFLVYQIYNFTGITPGFHYTDVAHRVHMAVDTANYSIKLLIHEKSPGNSDRFTCFNFGRWSLIDKSFLAFLLDLDYRYMASSDIGRK